MPPHQLTVLSLFGLVFWYLGWSLYAWSGPVALFWDIFWLLPLIAPLPRILAKSTYAYSILGFVAIFYLMHGVMSAFAPDRLSGYGYGIVLLSLMMFSGVIAFLRPYKIQARKNNAATH